MKARIEIYVTLWIVLVLVGTGLAFAPPHALDTRRCGGLHMMAGGHDTLPFCRQHSILYSTPSKDKSESETTLSTEKEPVAEAPAAPVQTEPEGTQPPINVPSPLLLATSMVLAIASTGSVFELTSGNPPQFGVPVTAAIAVLGIPSCLFLFYAAILKGIAETEEDDKAFLGK